MKKKATFLIGLLLLLMVVWGFTYFGLNRSESGVQNKSVINFCCE